MKLKSRIIKGSGILMGAVALILSMGFSSKNTEKPTSGKAIVLTDEAFDKTISKGVTLVDFWAVWCGPCRIQGPIVDKVAGEIGSKAKICKLDVDNNRSTANKFSIRSIPTILIFKDGKVVKTFVGVQSKETLLAAVQSYL